MHASGYADVTYPKSVTRDTTYRDPMATPLAAIVTIASRNKKITVPTGLFINNEFVPSCDSEERIRSSEQ